MLPPLVGMAGVQRFAHPVEHFIVEVEPTEQFGEFLFEHLLADIAAPTGSRVSQAFIGVSGAVIVDVAIFLISPTTEQPHLAQAIKPGESKIMRLPRLAS